MRVGSRRASSSLPDPAASAEQRRLRARQARPQSDPNRPGAEGGGGRLAAPAEGTQKGRGGAAIPRCPTAGLGLKSHASRRRLRSSGARRGRWYSGAFRKDEDDENPDHVDDRHRPRLPGLLPLAVRAAPSPTRTPPTSRHAPGPGTLGPPARRRASRGLDHYPRLGPHLNRLNFPAPATDTVTVLAKPQGPSPSTGPREPEAAGPSGDSGLRPSPDVSRKKRRPRKRN